MKATATIASHAGYTVLGVLVEGAAWVPGGEELEWFIIVVVYSHGDERTLWVSNHTLMHMLSNAHTYTHRKSNKCLPKCVLFSYEY